jgi:hypothetical protein
MEPTNYWRLCHNLTVVQAALLISNHDPTQWMAFVEGWPMEKRPKGYEEAKTALSQALLNRELDGSLRHPFERDPIDEINVPNRAKILPMETTVVVASLKIWLKNKGVACTVFPVEPVPANGNADSPPPYLDPRNPRYSKKLAAAVSAWTATETASRGTVKKALVKWLKNHGKDFGLVDEGGSFNQQGIEEVAKVANWEPRGGAPKTP